MSTQIFKTDFQAKKQAKHDFATLLNISPKSVRIEADKYSNHNWSSATCCCGETKATHFKMSNIGPKQAEILETKLITGKSLRYGVCNCCGTNF